MAQFSDQFTEQLCLESEKHKLSPHTSGNANTNKIDAKLCYKFSLNYKDK